MDKLDIVADEESVAHFVKRINKLKPYSPQNSFIGWTPGVRNDYEDAIGARVLHKNDTRGYISSQPLRELWNEIQESSEECDFSCFDEFYLDLNQTRELWCKVAPKDGRRPIGPDNFILYIE